MSSNFQSQEILSLPQSKNRCLDRLMESTREFLKQPTEKMIEETDEAPSALSTYEDERGAVIRTLELHDRKINELISTLRPEEKTEAFMTAVKAELLANERLIVAVFNADDIVFRKIREAQAQISKLVVENRKSREILAKFKSASNSATGEEMDQTL